MDYIELKCILENPAQLNREILIAEFAETEYESFQETDDGLCAYIPKEKFDLYKAEKIVKNHNKLLGKVNITYTVYRDKNWNEYWEKNFNPVRIENKIFIRAPFHPNQPHQDYEIVLEPKMAFGTGHHDSTYLMLKHMINMDFEHKNVLDMGCGTAILSIFAGLKNARSVLAVDNNEWAIQNAKENIRLNKVQDIHTLLGDIHDLKEKTFHCILANINLNVLKEEIPYYRKCLLKGGDLIISGFLIDHENIMLEASEKLGFRVKLVSRRNNWTAIHLIF